MVAASAAVRATLVECAAVHGSATTLPGEMAKRERSARRTHRTEHGVTRRLQNRLQQDLVIA
jgi:hypothetical protein